MTKIKNKLKTGLNKIRHPPKSLIFELTVIILIVILFILSFVFKSQMKEFVTKELVIYGFITMGVLSFLFELLPQYITPHLLLIQASILELPMLKSLVVVIVCSLLGSALGFEIGKHYGKKIIRKIYEKKFFSIERGIKKHERWILAVAAVSPIPYIPLIFGSIGVTRMNFIIYGLIIRAIGLVVFSLFFI